MKPSANVLVLTVGTGNVDRLEESLFRPLEKSLKDGNWKEAVLLPSTMTEGNAEEFRNRMHDYSIRILPLPEEGQENDADACFSHFDAVLNELKQNGYRPEAITSDFTRGTKAMSAALVLASVRHKIPTLRYIQGARDSRGMVLAGAEEVSEVATGRATTRHRIDDALQLMRTGAFAAVRELLPDVDKSQFAEILVPKEFKKEISRLRHLAAFWSAWDRLDYKAATQCANELIPSDAKELKEEVARVKRLAERPNSDNHAAMAEWLRWVAADLLANGCRRIGHHQFEDAILRAYRVLELIGQFRLFAEGYDSACFNPEDAKVEKFRKYLKKKKSEDFGTRKKEGREVLTASRMLAARFLKHLGDPFGEELLNFDKEISDIKVNARNLSILIHGFSVAEDLDEKSLSDLYARIKALLDEDCSYEKRGFNPDHFGIVPSRIAQVTQNNRQ